MSTLYTYLSTDVWKNIDGDEISPVAFTLGVTKPDATNTGLVSATTSVNSAADTTFSTNGQVVTDTRFDGNINVTGDNVSFYNCWFRGKETTTGNNIVRANDAGQTGAIFERCLFENKWFPSDNAANGAHGGIQCHDTTLIRCEIKSATDGIGIVAPGNVTAQGCYIHGLWFFSPDSGHLTDGTHCDGIQGHGGTIGSVVIEGCTIEGLLNDALPNSQASIDPVYSGSNLIAGNSWKVDFFDDWDGIYDFPPWGTSAILFGGTAVNSLSIINNWLDGGGYAAINLNNNITDASSSAVVITGNRIGPNVRDKTGGNGYVLINSSSLSSDLTLSGNTNEVGGAANNTRRNG